MTCVNPDCFVRRAFGFFFCRKCWKRLTEVTQTRIQDAWTETEKGDVSAKRCLAPALRDGIRELQF